MTKSQSVLPDDINIDCPHQSIGQGILVCRCASLHVKYGTNEVSEIICHNCDVGKIYREVGCDAFTAKLWITTSLGGTHPSIQSIFCSKRKRETSLEYCRECQLVGSPTTRDIVSTTRGLFQTDEYYTAYKHIEDARRQLRDGDFDGTITRSVSCLESVLKTVLDRIDVPYPRDETLTALWKAVRESLGLDTLCSSESEKALLSTLTGAVTHLGGIRNQLGDAHGKGEIDPEVPYLIAELSLNTAATLATYVIRRYHQIRRQ